MSFYLAPTAKFSQAFGVNNRNLVVGATSIDAWRDLNLARQPIPSDYLPEIESHDLFHSEPPRHEPNVNFPPIHAFLWREGRLQDLNLLVGDPHWELVEARDINENGSIVGWGYKHGVPIPRAFLLIPNAKTGSH